MLTLHGSMLHLEGRYATEAELKLAHSAEYLAQVRAWVARATERGGPTEVTPDLVASSATWEASLAAVGSVLEGMTAVARGHVRNAFCAVRPPGRDARSNAPGRYGFLNPVSVGVAWLLHCGLAERVLVVEWGAAPSGSPGGGDSRVRFATVEADSARSGDAFLQGISTALAQALGDFRPNFIALSSGFEWLSRDRTAEGSLEPADYYEATRRVTELADRICGGRLVSILDGGYESESLAAAAVEHVRGLTGLPPLVADR